MILREYGNKALPFVLGYHKLENIIPVLMSIGCKGCEINHLNFEYISTMNPVPFELLSSFLRHQMIQYRRALSTHYQNQEKLKSCLSLSIHSWINSATGESDKILFPYSRMQFPGISNQKFQQNMQSSLSQCAFIYQTKSELSHIKSYVYSPTHKQLLSHSNLHSTYASLAILSVGSQFQQR